MDNRPGNSVNILNMFLHQFQSVQIKLASPFTRLQKKYLKLNVNVTLPEHISGETWRGDAVGI